MTIRLRLLAALGAAAAVSLVLPGAASAAQLWFGDTMDPPPGSYGANAFITIGGTISFINTCDEKGTNDRFAAFADVYIVPTGSVSIGSELTDVGGAPNTVGPAASGGLYDDTTIGFTKPSGKIPSGTFDIVYDECQDKKFDARDTVFSPGIIVNVPTAAVPDVTGAIQAAKDAAGREALPWLILLKSVEAVEELQKKKALIECIQSGIAGCAVSTLVNMAQDFLKEQFMKAFGTTDPNDAAKIYVGNHIKKYAAIAADPPDPNFLTPSAVILPPQLVSPSADPLLRAHVEVGNAAGVEAALADAFLQAIERYQGADADDHGDAALMHARAIRSHAQLVAAQAGRTSAALDDLVAAYAADSRDFDDATAQLEQLRARVEADGFTAEELRTLRNLGLSAADLEALHEKISDDSYAGFTEAGLAASVAEIQSANDGLANAMLETASNMNSIVSALSADPVTSADAPIAIAGGPYTASAGAPVTLDGSGSAVYPGRTVASYEWDLDGDGVFDDATGATPATTFATGGDRIVGLRVTDSEGLSG
ncbi:MAG: PKD domain-containing protein, partial [Actinomycetota bacterium]|nr:PKD domain-containing protein [Actinomycetota bacterium]